ncbi:MAG: hypothetical protein ACLFOC_11610 [Campylobacterales bacterium]
MSTLTVRKNFKFEKETIDKVAVILKNKHHNFTEVLNNYFQAIIKEPELIDTIEKKAKKRTGSFIGILDGKIGDESYKKMKKSHHEHIS